MAPYQTVLPSCQPGRTPPWILLLCGCLLLAAPVAGAQPDPTEPTAAEIRDLKRRVAELETQNRRMAQLLSALEARLGPEHHPVAAPAADAGTGGAVARPSGALDGSGLPPPGVLSASAAARAPQKREIAPDPAGVRIYGLLRLDVDIDTQRPNSPQTPLFITSPSSDIGGSFAMHPRLTRVGIDLAGPRLNALGGAEIAGKLETDFENGGTESRQIIRIRHAYLKSAWKDFSILAGQTWDVFSPLFPTVNNDTLMWTAGNVGDRRPQLQAAYESKAGRGQVSLAGAIGLSGAVDALDLDHNGYADGIQSMRPDVQLRLGYARELWVADQAFSLGGSMFRGWLAVAGASGDNIFPAQGYNADLLLPLTDALAFRGEGWWGRNLSDFRGGGGQGITPATRRVVRGRGGWAELKLRVNRYWSVAPGFTTDNPVKADLVAGSRTRNRAFYVGNRVTPGGRVEFGIDYLRWRTDYFGSLPGLDNRINLFFQCAF